MVDGFYDALLYDQYFICVCYEGARVGRYGILNVNAIFQIGYCDITIYCIKNLNQINLFKV